MPPLTAREQSASDSASAELCTHVGVPLGMPPGAPPRARAGGGGGGSDTAPTSVIVAFAPAGVKPASRSVAAQAIWNCWRAPVGAERMASLVATSSPARSPVPCTRSVRGTRNAQKSSERLAFSDAMATSGSASLVGPERPESGAHITR